MQQNSGLGSRQGSGIWYAVGTHQGEWGVQRSGQAERRRKYPHRGRSPFLLSEDDSMARVADVAAG